MNFRKYLQHIKYHASLHVDAIFNKKHLVVTSDLTANCSQPKIIILIVETSFGEIDWILPVFHKLLQDDQDWTLVTVFGHEGVLRKSEDNSTLFRLFKKVCWAYLLPNALEDLFSNHIQAGNVKFIFKDSNVDGPIKQHLSRICPKAVKINFPHSHHIYSNKEVDTIQEAPPEVDYTDHDYFLLGSEQDIPFWSIRVPLDKIVILGSPKYDNWWMRGLLTDQDFLASDEVKMAGGADRVFFYISRGTHPHYLNSKDYVYLVESILRTVRNYENAVLFIKTHPRQDFDELNAIIQRFPELRVCISGLHLIQLSSLADVVISGWSSGIIDALAMQKPVIEFWRFGGKDPIVRKTADGRDTTIYRELGLAEAADTEEELRGMVRLAFEEPGNEVWLRQKTAFQENIKFTDDAAGEIARWIADMAF